MTTKTIQELDEMREERGINKVTLSTCCGATPGAWSNSISQNSISLRFKRNAIRVLKFYDKDGIVPVPGEVELEPLGRLPSG